MSKVLRKGALSVSTFQTDNMLTLAYLTAELQSYQREVSASG